MYHPLTEAWEAGYDAYSLRKHEEDCPYEDNDTKINNELRQYWLLGYRWAEQYYNQAE